MRSPMLVPIALALFSAAPAAQLVDPQRIATDRAVHAVPADVPLPASLYRAWLGRDLPLAELRAVAGPGFVDVNDRKEARVEIFGPVGQAAVSDAFLAGFGARADTRVLFAVEAAVPVDRLVDLARALPAGHRIARATPGHADDVAGEGPGVMLSDVYRDGGADGAGLTIAVVDADFDQLDGARTNGDAPSSWVQVNYTPDPFQDDSAHGTGCVEAAFDHAPGASYRLYKVDSATDFLSAAVDCVSNGVDVVSRSLSNYNLGWGDDTGVACVAANHLGQNGIPVFVSAGNRAQEHWQGTFDPGSGGSAVHDWTTGDELNRVVIDPDGSTTFYLSWDTSGSDTDDYGLFVYDASGSTVLGSSLSLGEGFESVQITNGSTVSTLTVNLLVLKTSGVGNAELELFSHGNVSSSWEHLVTAGSTTSPSNATDPNVISVGAVAHGDFSSPNGTSGILKSYSSRGPSNSGMQLPDLLGPTDTTAFAYPNGFGGTSCATPNLAGAAMVFRDSVPQYSATAITWLLEQQAEVTGDWGGAGPGNSYGHGGVHLTAYAPGYTVFLSRSFGNTANAATAPSYTLAGAVADSPSGGRILVYPGGSYPEPVVVDVPRLLQSDGGSAVFGD